MGKKDKLKVAVIREELVELTGDAISALLLNQAILHHHSVENMDEPIEAMIEQLKENGNTSTVEELEKNLRNGWFYKSAKDLYKEIMISSRATVQRRLKELTDKGYLKKGGQYYKEGIKSAGDRNWWKVNIDKVRQDLDQLGYTLKGYKKWSEDEGAHGEQGVAHGEQGGVHSEQGVAHGEHHHRILSKNPSESSPKRTSEILSIKENEIEKADLPNPIKTVLKEQIDRLIVDQIEIKNIERNFVACKDQINESLYAEVLESVLIHTKKKIHSISHVMNVSVNNAINNLSKDTQTSQSKDITPDWYKENKHKEKPIETTSPDEMTEEQKKVAELLKQFA